ncbi:hypothetical protein DM02DRAFT_615009, partial [Periconia macrospinosa]
MTPHIPLYPSHPIASHPHVMPSHAILSRLLPSILACRAARVYYHHIPHLANLRTTTTTAAAAAAGNIHIIMQLHTYVFTKLAHPHVEGGRRSLLMSVMM